MGIVDRPPDLVDEIRALKSRIHELEQRVRAAEFLSPIIARVTVGTVSIPNTSTTTISFTAATEDTAGAWSPLLPDRLSAPREGMYIVTSLVQFAGNGTGDRQGFAFNSGSGGSAGNTIRAPGTEPAQLTPTYIGECEEGDTIRLSCWQNSGAPLNLTAGVLAIMWIGPRS